MVVGLDASIIIRETSFRFRSMSEIAKDFKAKIGDELIFDVQGMPIKTTIASLRTIDWKRFQTNFFVLFPAGVLENRAHVSCPGQPGRDTG